MQTHLLLKAFPTARVETRSEEKLIERERGKKESTCDLWSWKYALEIGKCIKFFFFF